MRSADVVVVGAGPAGTAAAVTLARGGRDVLVVDRARFPRDKCCGDGLTTGALRLLARLGLDPTAMPSWTPVGDAWVRSPSGRTVRFPLPDDGALHAAVARRVDLDAALVALARDAGATVLDGHALTGAVARDDAVALEVAGVGRVVAPHVVGADGMWSPLRRFLGHAVPDYRGEWHAFRQYFTGVGPLAAERLWVWFEEDLLPGYAWSFPLAGGVANVGFGILRTDGASVQAMASQWRDLLARPHVREVLGEAAVPEGPHRAWPIPARVTSATLSAGRALFVGDAAAATDALTGEGIGQALLTGVLAAEAVLSAPSGDPGAVAARYERDVARHFAADHRLSVVLGAVLRRPLGARGAVRVAGSSDWTRRNFARWLFEDYPRAVLATPRRWHRGMLTAPGARF